MNLIKRALLLVKHFRLGAFSVALSMTMTVSAAVTLPSESDSQSDLLKEFQSTVSEDPVTYSGPLLSVPVRIAVIHPSADISDFWVRNYTAMTERLEELNIQFTVDEYSSKQIEHALQSQHAQTVLASAQEYDFVIFGPTELALQAKTIQNLSENESFKTLIWAFHTPDPQWQYQPDGWFDFSSAMGSVVLCEHVVNRLGEDVFFALNRGIPGITDTQRSQGFVDCVEEKGNWLEMYEHFGQYQRLGGVDGVKLILENFPEVTMIHNANTAMTIGALEALKEADKLEDIFVTGWGGTAREIEKIRANELDATPMRISDDLGVATAEAIKLFIEGRDQEVPYIYLGRIIAAHSEMADEELDELTNKAFRYSGLPD